MASVTAISGIMKDKNLRVQSIMISQQNSWMTSRFQRIYFMMMLS